MKLYWFWHSESLRYDFKGCWSRRINREHRIVYKIEGKRGKAQKCIILQCRYHSIKSRDFAAKFRSEFKMYEDDRENVSVNYGPLTLMQGWSELVAKDLENTIIHLANNFIKIEHVIDKTLQTFEKPSF